MFARCDTLEKTGVTHHIIKIIRQRHRYFEIYLVPWVPTRRYFMRQRKKKIKECAGFQLVLQGKKCKLFVPYQDNTWHYTWEDFCAPKQIPKNDSCEPEQWNTKVFRSWLGDPHNEKSEVYMQGVAIFDAIYEEQKKTPISITMWVDWMELKYLYNRQGPSYWSRVIYDVVGVFRYISCHLDLCVFKNMESLLMFFAAFDPHPKFLVWRFMLQVNHEIRTDEENDGCYPANNSLIRGAANYFKCTVEKFISLNIRYRNAWTYRKIQDLVEYVKHNTCLPRQLVTENYITNNNLGGNLFGVFRNNNLVLAELVTRAIGQQIYTSPISVLSYLVDSEAMKYSHIYIPIRHKMNLLTRSNIPTFDGLPIKPEIQRDFYYAIDDWSYSDASCYCKFGDYELHDCHHTKNKAFGLYVLKQKFYRYVANCRWFDQCGTEMAKRIWQAAEIRAANGGPVDPNWETEKKLREASNYCAKCQTFYRDTQHKCPLTFGRFLLWHTLYDPRLLILISAFAENADTNEIPLLQTVTEQKRIDFLIHYFEKLNKNDARQPQHMPRFIRLMREARKDEYPENFYLLSLKGKIP